MCAAPDVDGVGAQGGDVEGTVQAGHDPTGQGLRMSSSRAILYAGNGVDYADAAARVAAQFATRSAW